MFLLLTFWLLSSPIWAVSSLASVTQTSPLRSIELKQGDKMLGEGAWATASQYTNPGCFGEPYEVSAVVSDYCIRGSAGSFTWVCTTEGLLKIACNDQNCTQSCNVIHVPFACENGVKFSCEQRPNPSANQAWSVSFQGNTGCESEKPWAVDLNTVNVCAETSSGGYHIAQCNENSVTVQICKASDCKTGCQAISAPVGCTGSTWFGCGAD